MNRKPPSGSLPNPDEVLRRMLNTPPDPHAKKVPTPKKSAKKKPAK